MPSHSRFGSAKPNFQDVETARFCRRELSSSFALSYALLLPVFALIYRPRNGRERRTETDCRDYAKSYHFHENYSFLDGRTWRLGNQNECRRRMLSASRRARAVHRSWTGAHYAPREQT